MALSGFIVKLDRSIRLLSSVLKAKEVKAGKDAVDGLNKALFLPSLSTSIEDEAEDILRSAITNKLYILSNRRKKMLDH